MDIRLIETFVEAARRSSFSAAAKHLGVTPAAVSQNIKALELSLQARLFSRTTRSVTLTPAGERYFRRCDEALQQLHGATSALHDERDEMRGSIKISSATSFGRSQILPLINQFLGLHPDLRIELVLSDDFTDLVADGFDFGVRGGVLPINDYVSRQLLAVTPLVVASKAYLDDHGEPASIEDLARHRCLAMRSTPSQRLFSWHFASAGGAIVQVDVTPYVVVNEMEALARLAALGTGVAQIGSNIAMPLIARGELRPCLTELAVVSRGMYVVYPNRRYLPRRVAELIEFSPDGPAGRIRMAVFAEGYTLAERDVYLTHVAKIIEGMFGPSSANTIR